MGHLPSRASPVSRSSRRNGGFSLLEIAVVIAIIGLITAGVSAMLTAVLKTSKSRLTADNATTIQVALQRFVERSGRLPCPALIPDPPAQPTGTEDVVTNDATTTCDTTKVSPTNEFARGAVPWTTLGLPFDQVQDGYARLFTYNVTRAATISTLNTNTIAAVRGNMTLHTGTPVAMGSPRVPGRNQINSCWIDAALPPAAENSCNMNAIVVLVSHGENGLGARASQGGALPLPTDAGEIENTNGTVAFVKSDPTNTGFDDFVIAWSPDELLDPLIRRNTVKSAIAETNERMRNIALAISNAIVNAAANCAVPPCGPANFPTAPLPTPPALPAPPTCQTVQGIALLSDAWGNCLQYATPIPAANICGTTTGTFTITSRGLDGVATPGTTNPNTGLNDDFVLTVTVDQIRSQIATRFGAC